MHQLHKKNPLFSPETVTKGPGKLLQPWKGAEKFLELCQGNCVGTMHFLYL
jgi:hypothetical protein